LEKISVGLTQFLDFLLRGSTARVTAVHNIKYQPPYHPAMDFWRKLRDEIKTIHQNNYNLSRLDALLNDVDQKKIHQYADAVHHYKKFCSGKKIEWFDVGDAFWSFHNLAVRSTPELGLIINGTPYRIKMYFKEHRQKLDKRLSDALLTLMEDSFLQIPNEATSAVLNVKRSRLIPLDKAVDSKMRIALEGDAMSFIQIWNSI